MIEHLSELNAKLVIIFLYNKQGYHTRNQFIFNFIKTYLTLIYQLCFLYKKRYKINNCGH